MKALCPRCGGKCNGGYTDMRFDETELGPYGWFRPATMELGPYGWFRPVTINFGIRLAFAEFVEYRTVV
jgi:hypothetical protein